MKRWMLLLTAFLLAACAGSSPAAPTPNEQITKTEYPDLGPAPELSGDVWLNTTTPLRMADLRGKVVLVDMWTFG